MNEISVSIDKQPLFYCATAQTRDLEDIIPDTPESTLRLNTGINGWLPKKQNGLIWNRTVNYRGGAGHNLEMDLMNEFLNREFKGAHNDLEDIIPDTPESTLRLNTGRNLFDYIQDIQQSVKELHQKFDRENKFRIEGGVKKELGVIAKAAFGTDIFNVSDCFIVSIA
ncbi:unnamed protein product [Mytilus edulis]|uniref:Uncharacterized protein n=1 Tax=Mytilus edulis TaxID=6550 RepID=A0A8S3UFX2_MYTED|nr:unnamed protein product [Mytilus edulis]